MKKLILFVVLLAALVGAADPQQVFIRRAAAGVDTPADFCTSLGSWHKPESLESSGTDGAEIATWADDSGNSNDMTCDTATQDCPVYNENAYASTWWSADNDALGLARRMTNVTEDSYTDFTMGIAFIAGSANTGPSVGNDNNNQPSFMVDNGNDFRFSDGGNIEYQSGAAPTDGLFQYIVIERASSDVDMWVDGTLDTADVDNTSGGAYLFGALFSNASNDGGQIVEVWICSDTGVVSDANTYFADKY